MQLVKMPVVALSYANSRFSICEPGVGRARAPHRAAGLRAQTRMHAARDSFRVPAVSAQSDYYDEGFLMDKLFDSDGRVRSVHSLRQEELMEEFPTEAQEMMMVANAAAPGMIVGEVSGGVAAMFGALAVIAAAVFHRFASVSQRVASYDDARKILRTVKMEYLSDEEIAEGRAKRLASMATGPSVVRPKNTPPKPVRPNPRANDKLDPSVTKILQR